MRLTMVLLTVMIALAALWFARAASASDVGALDERGFAQAALDGLRKRVPDGRFTLRKQDGHAVIEQNWADGNTSTWFVGGNAYQQYRGDPAQLEALVDHQLRSWNEMRARMSASTPAHADAAAHVLPVIKTRGWFTTTAAQLASVAAPDKRVESEPLHRELAGDLVLVFAEDDANNMRFVSRGALASLQLSDDAALEQRALDNLAARLPELRITGKAGRYRLEFDNFYEASMVLLIGRWRDRLTLDGDPIIAIAARNTVLICGSHDSASIESLRKYAADISAQAAYGLSATLYTVRGGKLESYAH